MACKIPQGYQETVRKYTIKGAPVKKPQADILIESNAYGVFTFL